MNAMENKVTMDLECLGNARLGDWNCTEWKVELHYNGKSLHTPFYTGVAIAEPRIEDVLGSLFDDGDSARDFDSFEDWASAYGYNSDSKSDEDIYNSCLEISNELADLFGDDYDYFKAKFENF